MAGYLQFLGQFIRNPRQVGSIAPSSPFLADAITSSVRLREAKVVVELGPGTGAFTAEIMARLKPGAVFFAMEVNEPMCERLRRRLPGAKVYCDSAARIGHYLARHGVAQADCIVSSLPWAAFGPELQDELMTAVYDSLRPGGQFATFAYLQGTVLPSGRRFHDTLKQRFEEVSRSHVVWQNLPPAFVYKCTKDGSRV